MIPPYPLELKTGALGAGTHGPGGPLDEKGGAAGSRAQKVVRRGRKNTWIAVDTLPKSLIVDRNLPTGLSANSTTSKPPTTTLDCFSTLVYFRFSWPNYLYLILSIEEEREKEPVNKEKLIHRLDPLLKKASTDFTFDPPLFGGNMWMGLFIGISNLVREPRTIHRSTAATPLYPPSFFHERRN